LPEGDVRLPKMFVQTVSQITALARRWQNSGRQLLCHFSVRLLC